MYHGEIQHNQYQRLRRRRRPAGGRARGVASSLRRSSARADSAGVLQAVLQSQVDRADSHANAGVAPAPATIWRPRTRCCALARPIKRAPESCRRCRLFFQTRVVTLTPTSLPGCAGAVDQLRGHRLFRGCEETCGGTMEKVAERFSL